VGIALNGDGTFALVGVIDDGTGGTAAGTAYLFQLSGGSWSLAATFTGASGETLFGTSASLSADGSVAVIGAPVGSFPLFAGGCAYIYCGSNWATQTKLTGTATCFGFGSECSANSGGSVVAVTAPGSGNGDFGTIFIYSGQNWQEQASIKNPNTGSEFLFASPSLSADGQTLAAIAIGASSQTVYVFTNTSSGWSLTATPPLTGSKRWIAVDERGRVDNPAGSISE
jgi:hypothetical protein